MNVGTWVSLVDINMVKWGHRSSAHMIQVGVYSRLEGQIVSQIQGVHQERLRETLWANPWRSIIIIAGQQRGFGIHTG